MFTFIVSAICLHFFKSQLFIYFFFQDWSIGRFCYFVSEESGCLWRISTNMESGSIRNPGSTHFLDNWIPSMKIVNIPPHFWSYVRTNSAYFWRENSNISNSWYFDGRIQKYDKNIDFGGKIQIFEKFNILTDKFKSSKIIHFCAKFK